MSGTLMGGPLTWSMDVDEEGYREYKVAHIVRMSSLRDGPYLALQTPGLPAVGSVWAFPGCNDIDSYAYCKPSRSITIHQEKEGDPARFYKIESQFTTKPAKFCQDQSVDDPLLMPVKKSGSFLSKPKEATHDRHGNPLLYSSHERIQGPAVEFDRTRATVDLEVNVVHLQLSTLAAAMNCVNDGTLWGMASRTVKLSSIGWEEKYYGMCYIYYTWKLGFEVDPAGFDRDEADQGTKVLNGYWERDPNALVLDPSDPNFGQSSWGTWQPRKIAGDWPDRMNPTHFIRYKDWNGENTRVLLNGLGEPAISTRHVGTGTGSGSWDIGTAGAGAYRHIEAYDEYDFYLLGVPATLGS